MVFAVLCITAKPVSKPKLFIIRLLEKITTCGQVDHGKLLALTSVGRSRDYEREYSDLGVGRPLHKVV